ncbi:MAG: hypothetical protein K5694_00240 [Bacilli bacterium]|nr:hypothetical protein [Bacilli bacterium]
MKRSILLTIATLALTSCGGSTPSSSSSQEASSVSSEVSSVISSESEEKSLPSVSWSDEDYVADSITVGDPFIDIGVGCHLVVGYDYYFSFAFGDNVTTNGATIESSNPDVLAISYEGSQIKGTVLTAGDVIIVVKDYTGYMHYRNKVTCRDAINEEYLDEYLSYDVFYFTSCNWLNEGNNLKMTFLGEGEGIFTGRFNNLKIDEGATFKYERKSALDDTHNLYYYYTVTMDNPAVNFNPEAFTLHYTGEMLHLYDDSGLMDAFVPTLNK